jgi:hypothetical protein
MLLHSVSSHTHCSKHNLVMHALCSASGRKHTSYILYKLTSRMRQSLHYCAAVSAAATLAQISCVQCQSNAYILHTEPLVVTLVIVYTAGQKLCVC